MAAPEGGAEEAQKLKERLEEKVQNDQWRTQDFNQIPDDLAIILMALNRTLGSNIFERTFFRSECRSLAPTDTDSFITKLWHGGVILDDPRKAKPNAYFLKDDQLWHYNNLVAYFVIHDENCEIAENALMLLQNRPFRDVASLRALWLDYAVSDCMAYLFGQTDLHGMSIDDVGIQEIRATLHTALQRYSISELWSAIWKVVKDAAALAQREYYNKAKATATISGKLMRHLESVAKGKAELKLWDRPADQPAGTIGQVFYDFFDLDENARGAELDIYFPENDVQSTSTVVLTDALRSSIDALISRVKKQGCSPEMMLSFAEAISQGLKFDDAVRRIEDQYPAPKRGRAKQRLVQQ